VQLSLVGYTTAVLGDVVTEPVGRQVADELTSVAHLVSRTNELAVVLTDFAVPRPARRAVLGDLLGSRIGSTALRLVLQAVKSERADRLPTSLHELYELVIHLHELGPAQVRAEEPITTRGAWRAFASGFATAVFEEVRDVPELEEVEDELFRFARVVESNPGLRSALSDVSRSTEDRVRLVVELLEGKVRPATLRVVQIPLQGRVRDFVNACDWLAELAASARGWRVATVYTARPIDDSERAALAEEVQHITGQEVELHVLDRPDLIGGAIVQVGDLLVDASVEHRLEALGEHLLGKEGAMTGAMN
jgi:F-type H+-transporting ATPase subunit delta